MKTYLKPILVGMALVLALTLTIARREPPGMPQFGLGGYSSRAERQDKKRYDLLALRIFNSSLMRINDSYVDPGRVDNRQMLLAALDQVQKSVAEVLVEPFADQNRVMVRVDTVQRDFSIAEVDSPWALSSKVREIFRFISQNLPADTDVETVRNIEYSATNGMLSTLDPHSVLLDPQMFSEMQLSTRGSFGGLGIVIGLRKGALTVIRPMPGTPASQAGVKSGDRITRIDKQSTVNMMLNDAVARLRGDPDTKVELWIEKVGEKNPVAKKLVLTRAVIQVKTVDAHLLKNNVGYVKLYNSFGQHTIDEMRRALDDLKQKGMKSLVLDLRSNPGGLLEQAVKVADEFVDSGVLVTTVGEANKRREERRATPGNQPHMPMAVLVNQGSASASEIVAGALKNLDRAVVVGSRTFGKGSVQVLYENDDGSALKLTIAQYLTPGDVSIQTVGITPDVMLEKVAVDKDKGVWLFRGFKGLREADLDAHLESDNAKSTEQPFETVKYLAPTAPAKPARNLLRDDNKEDLDDEEEAEEQLLDEDIFVEDYEIQFARDLLAQAKGWKRREILAGSKGFFEKKVTEERGKVAEALGKLGADWTSVGAQKGAKLRATLQADRPNWTVEAGQTIRLTAAVTNTGTQMAGQVRAQLKTDDPLFDGREFVFGRVKPGETRNFVVLVKTPKDSLTRVDPLRMEFFDENKSPVELPAETLLHITGVRKPVFAYSYQLIDDLKGNGDGLVQRGESVRMHVSVKNVGKGKAEKTYAQLRNLAGEGLDVNKGRFELENLAPGETKSIDFTFDVRGDYHPDSFKVELSVYDAVLHEYVTDKLSFPIAAPQPTEGQSGGVRVTADAAQLWGAATIDSPVVATAKKGGFFVVTGAFGNFYRVELEKGRPAFVQKTAVERSNQGSPGAVAFVPNWQVSPPQLELQNSDLIVDGASFKLKGSARDERKVADVFVFVSNRLAKIDRRKVFYRSNRKGNLQSQIDFEADIPLWPGANIVSVVARENAQVQTVNTLIVDRKSKKPATAAIAAEQSRP